MRYLRTLAIIAILSAMLVACGGDDDGGEASETTATSPEVAATATTQQAAPTTSEGGFACEIAIAGDIASYSGGYRVYCVNADGSELRPLTATPPRDFAGEPYEAFPAWSPDGSQVAFTRHGFEPGVIIVDADGGNERHLADGWATDITWSPGGSRLAFAWLEDGWSPDTDALLKLVIIDADGSNMRIISDNPDLQGQKVEALRPSWSPDGTRLLFQHLGPSTSELYVVNADGSDLQRVDTGDLEVFYGSQDITWTPNGEALAIRGTGPGEPNLPGLFCLPLDGGEPERLTPEYLPAISGLVYWSPDGTQIAYASTTQDLDEVGDGLPANIDIYVVDVESGDARRVTDTPEMLEGAGPWSPEGSRLLYLTVPIDAESGHLQDLRLAIINADGTNPITIIEGFSMREELSGEGTWRPLPQ